jgi:hypothetical protein
LGSSLVWSFGMIKATMSELTINTLSALAVSGIITSMSRVHSQKLKAILYTLPFPITIALIGSNSVATSLSLLGLMLTASFLWGCYYLYAKRGMKVLYADAFLALLYVLAAYILAQSVKASFWAMLAVYLFLWSSLMFAFRKITFKYDAEKPANTNTWLKAMAVFVIAYILFSAHQYLAAFVVTFPYNGVFAVFENRSGLLPQAALFTRNSIALAAYFVANYLVGTRHTAVVRYVCSWMAFVLVLLIVNKLIAIHVRDIRSSPLR